MTGSLNGASGHFTDYKRPLLFTGTIEKDMGWQDQKLSAHPKQLTQPCMSTLLIMKIATREQIPLTKP